MDWSIDIFAEGPLAFPERRFGEQYRASLPYVPGGTVFAALAAEHFDAGLFRALRCHNAYPVAADEEVARPLPLTALQEKGHDKGPIYDSLVARVCWEQQQPAGLLYAPADAEGRPWEAAGRRFYTLKGRSLALRSVSQRVLTRVGINRRRGSAEEGRLYSPLVINEAVYEAGQSEPRSSRFRGSVTLLDRDDDLQAWLEAISGLGTRQSSGLGAVSLRAQTQPAEDAAAIGARIAALTGRFQQQAQQYMQLGGTAFPIAERSIFSINLLADALLLEQGWLPTQQFSAAQLRAATGIEARLLRAFTGTSVIGGWHATWRQPKPTAPAVTMGSLFVFQAAAPLSEADCAALAGLQRRGIGDRRQEGYGQIRICDEFHTQHEWPRA
jgi:CRISPR-associated protein Csx10